MARDHHFGLEQVRQQRGKSNSHVRVVNGQQKVVNLEIAHLVRVRMVEPAVSGKVNVAVLCLQQEPAYFCLAMVCVDDPDRKLFTIMFCTGLGTHHRSCRYAGPHQGVVARSGSDHRRPQVGNPLQRVDLKVVIVFMRDENVIGFLHLFGKQGQLMNLTAIVVPIVVVLPLRGIGLPLTGFDEGFPRCTVSRVRREQDRVQQDVQAFQPDDKRTVSQPPDGVIMRLAIELVSYLPDRINREPVTGIAGPRPWRAGPL